MLQDEFQWETLCYVSSMFCEFNNDQSVHIRGKQWKDVTGLENIQNLPGICDPVQQKGHLVGQVHSEIMNKIVCKI